MLALTALFLVLYGAVLTGIWLVARATDVPPWAYWTILVLFVCRMPFDLWDWWFGRSVRARCRVLPAPRRFWVGNSSCENRSRQDAPVSGD